MKATWKPQPTRAVETLINIRYDFMPVAQITAVFQGKEPYSEKYKRALWEFFNEVPVSIMKRYMTEQRISREQIIAIFNILPDAGEKHSFERALQNGKF